MLRNAFGNIHHRRSRIRLKPMEERQPLIPPHIRADPGIQTHGTDIQGDPVIDPNQIEGGFLTVQEPFQIKKCFGIVKDFHKVIAATAGKHGDGYIVKPRCAVYHFVQGAVAAAGIDPVFTAGFRRSPGQTAAVAGCPGDLDFVGQAPLLAGSSDFLPVAFYPVFAAGCRVDDE